MIASLLLVTILAAECNPPKEVQIKINYWPNSNMFAATTTVNDEWYVAAARTQEEAVKLLLDDVKACRPDTGGPKPTPYGTKTVPVK